MATITANTGSNNWNTNAAWVGGSQPTAADDVVIPASAVVTIPSATSVVGRSLTVQASGTLAFAATTSTLSLGNATAGAGNVALSISASATITLTAIGTINLVSTSTTQQTIDAGGKTLPNITVNGAGSSYILSSALTSSGNLVLNAGTFNTNNLAMTLATLSVGASGVRTMTLGSSAITLTGSSSVFSFGNLTNLTFTANTAVLTITAAVVSFNNIVVMNSFNWNGLSLVITAAQAATVNISGATIRNLTITGTAIKTTEFRFNGSFTITDTLSVVGNSSVNRVLLSTTTRGTAAALTTTTLGTMSNVDLMDITAAGASSPWNLASITGLSGDCGGNSNITFTAPVAQTISVAGSWDDSSKWTSRVPLPQDDVTVSGSSAITLNMPRFGKSINMSGYTGTMTLTSSTGTCEFYGSMTLGSGMSWGTSPTTFNISAGGRSSYTIASNGKDFFPASTTASFAISAPNGTYTLTDALKTKSPTSGSFNISAGSFNSANYSIDTGLFWSQSTTTRAVSLGTSVVTLYAVGGSTIVSFAGAGITGSMENATFTVLSASASTRTVNTNDVTIGTFTYTVAGSTGPLSISGNSSFNTLNFSDATNARTLQISAGIRLAVNSNFNVFGTSGKLVTLKSATGGSKAYVSKPYGGPIAGVDYLSIQDIHGYEALNFYVGANCIDVSGNANIYFNTTTTYKHRQSTMNMTASLATSASATFPTSTTAGNLLVAFVNSANATGGGVTFTSGWTQAVISTSAGSAYLYYKKADGTETSVTHTQTSARIITIGLFEYQGFTGDPTLDVTSSNISTASVSALSTTSTTGPTNVSQPALALAFVGGTSNLAQWVSATNSFLPDYTTGVPSTGYLHAVVKELTTSAAVETTIGWTTARANVYTGLAVFKNVITSNGNFLQFF